MSVKRDLRHGQKRPTINGIPVVPAAAEAKRIGAVCRDVDSAVDRRAYRDIDGAVFDPTLHPRWLPFRGD